MTSGVAPVDTSQQRQIDREVLLLKDSEPNSESGPEPDRATGRPGIRGAGLVGASRNRGFVLGVLFTALGFTALQGVLIGRFAGLFTSVLPWALIGLVPVAIGTWLLGAELVRVWRVQQSGEHMD